MISAFWVVVAVAATVLFARWGVLAGLGFLLVSTGLFAWLARRVS